MKRIMKSALVIAMIFVWQFIPVSGFSQACVNCIDSTQNVSVGFLNTINTAETQQTVLGYNNTVNRNNAVAIGSMSLANFSHSYVLGSFSESKGLHSYVIGSSSQANAAQSYAIGTQAISNSTLAMAIGQYVEARAMEAIVIGIGDINDPLVHNIPHSLAVGFGSTIPTFFVGGSSSLTGTGKVGIATTDPQAKLHVNGDFQVGDAENPQEIRLHGSINATGTRATALGTNTIASAHSSFASGMSSEAKGVASTAIGVDALANADLSLAIGQFVSNYGSNSIVIGRGKSNDIRLTNGIANTMMIGFNSNYPTLFISETESGFQSGSIGIGNVTDPQAKLHIRADAQEDAALRLEATAADKYARIYFGDAHHITAANQQNMRFSLPADRSFIFENGSVGIGTDTPEAKLHISGGDVYLEDINFGIIMKSPNGKCWRGVMTDDGALSFSQVNCPGEASSVQNLPVEEGKLKAWPNPTNGNLIIESELYGSNTEILISTMEGKMMLRQMIFSDRTEVSLNNFPIGTYILQLLKNGQLVESRKVVKN